MSYNLANAHSRDSRVTFEDSSHSYSIDGVPVDRSVTQLVSSCFEPFDADYWAARKATPTRTAEMIKAEWERKAEEARNLGSLMHHRIEQYYLGNEQDSGAAADVAFRHFIAFEESFRLRPYRSEWVIFDEDLGLAGTLDFLAVNSAGEYEIYDWKRSNKVVDEYGKAIASDRFGKHAIAPLEHIPDTSFYHYALQLSLYRYILEKRYGIRPVAAHLGVFHPCYSRPYVVDVPYLRDEVLTLLSRLK